MLKFLAMPLVTVDRLNAISTLVIALFTIVMCGVIWYQLRAMRDQERAWVTVLPAALGPGFCPQWEEGDEPPTFPLSARPRTHHFKVNITNVGRTPAVLDGIAMHYIHSTTMPSEMIPEPEYGNMSNQRGYLLMQQEGITEDVCLTPDKGLLTKSQVTNIETGKEFLYAYGVVKYRDVYKRRHETRFGYTYQPPAVYRVKTPNPTGILRIDDLSIEVGTFRHGGPDAYNKAT